MGLTSVQGTSSSLSLNHPLGIRGHVLQVKTPETETLFLTSEALHIFAEHARSVDHCVHFLDLLGDAEIFQLEKAGQLVV